MYGYALRPVEIVAPGGRSGFFSMGAGDLFGNGWRPAAGRPYAPALGQTTNAEWYEMAKHQVRKFDNIVEMLRKIANKAAREELAGEYVGSPEDRDSGIYRRNSVENAVREAESYSPVNLLVFSTDRARSRIQALREITHDFLEEVREAEAYWGTLPEPQVIERIVEVQVPGGAPPAEPTPPLVPILLVGGLGVAALALLGVFGGK